MREYKKMIRIHSNGIEVLDINLIKRLNNLNLSASMVGGFLSCPADWFLDKYMLPMIEHEEGVHLERGNLFHKTMEEFFSLPKEERTETNLMNLAVAVTKRDYPHLLSDDESKAWITKSIYGYLDLGYDYQNENIKAIKLSGNSEASGIELNLKGKVGNVSRPIVGKIDKVIEKDGKIQIQDWKLGAKVHNYDPFKEIGPNNNFDYWRQQTLYTMLLEKEGINVSSAILVFPIAEEQVTVDIFNPQVRQQVIDDMELVDREFNKCVENRFFPFKPCNFCTWCHLLYPGRKVGQAKFPKITKKEFDLYADYVE